MVTTEIPFCRALPVPVMLAKYIAQFPVTISLAGNRFSASAWGWNTIQQHEKMGLSENRQPKNPIVYHHVSFRIAILWVYPIFRTNPNPKTVVPWKCVTAAKKPAKSASTCLSSGLFHHGGSTPLITLRQSNIAIDMVVFHGYVNDYHRGYGHNVQNDASNQWTLGYIFRQTQTSTESAVLAV